MQVSQMQPVSLGVLKNDGSGWVGKYGGRDFFHASSDLTRSIIHMLMDHGYVLRSARIYDVVWAFKGKLELTISEVMRAIIECFWLATNTFVTPNGELSTIGKSNFF